MKKSLVTPGAAPVERHGSLELFVIVPSSGAALKLQPGLQEEPLRG